MMLTAMHHADSTTYASPSPASAWQHQLLPADRGHLLYDYDLASVPVPPPSARPATTHAHQQQHRAVRRVGKRRPRPSRRLPVTYISADPAEFRRMVHQVTGADDVLLPPRAPEEELLLYRPAPAARAPAPSVAGALLLPTLDTSAFLLGRAARPAAAAVRPDLAPPPPCDGALALDNTSGCSNCGFPTLESWDLL